jgi:hypothetical protein
MLRDLSFFKKKNPTLSIVDLVLTESQKWSSDALIDRQILTEDGPWRGTDMIVAWELYFQAQGLAPGAQCERSSCPPSQPHVIVAKAEAVGPPQQARRILTGFCADCWKQTSLCHGRDEVPDMDFLFRAGVFETGKRIDPRARRETYFATIPSHPSKLLTSSRVSALEPSDTRLRWCPGRRESYNSWGLCGYKPTSGRGAYHGLRRRMFSHCRVAWNTRGRLVSWRRSYAATCNCTSSTRT